MKQFSDSGFCIGMSLEEEVGVRQHFLEILEEARETGEADDSLHLDEIYERFICCRTKQALAAMVRDGKVVRVERGRYLLARWVQIGTDCECRVPGKMRKRLKPCGDSLGLPPCLAANGPIAVVHAQG